MLEPFLVGSVGFLPLLPSPAEQRACFTSCTRMWPGATTAPSGETAHYVGISLLLLRGVVGGGTDHVFWSQSGHCQGEFHLFPRLGCSEKPLIFSCSDLNIHLGRVFSARGLNLWFQPHSLLITPTSQCHFVLFCDPQSLIRAVCVTISLELIFGHAYVTKDNECLSLRIQQ